MTPLLEIPRRPAPDCRAQGAWNPQALVLLGHGTRVKSRKGSLGEVRDWLRHPLGLGMPVVTAYLGMEKPGLAAQVRRLHARGARRVLVLPMLLCEGLHLSRDVPKALEEARQACPQVDLYVTAHLGADQALAELALLRVRQAREAWQNVFQRQPF